MNINWKTFKFHQLTTEQLYELIKFRIDIFVVEQRCPYPELDNKDRHAETSHIAGYDSSGVLIAYARLLPSGVSYTDVSIGRFAVIDSMRHQGIGSQLLERSLQEIEQHWPDTAIRVSAQEHLCGFYEKFNFEKVSESYLEDGIPHVEMLKTV